MNFIKEYKEMDKTKLDKPVKYPYTIFAFLIIVIIMTFLIFNL